MIYGGLSQWAVEKLPNDIRNTTRIARGIRQWADLSETYNRIRRMISTRNRKVSRLWRVRQRTLQFELRILYAIRPSMHPTVSALTTEDYAKGNFSLNFGSRFTKPSGSSHGKAPEHGGLRQRKP